MNSWIETEVAKLENKMESEGLTADEAESLCEYKGRLSSIEWERDYLNGETSL